MLEHWVHNSIKVYVGCLQSLSLKNWDGILEEMRQFSTSLFMWKATLVLDSWTHTKYIFYEGRRRNKKIIKRIIVISCAVSSLKKINCEMKVFNEI